MSRQRPLRVTLLSVALALLAVPAWTGSAGAVDWWGSVDFVTVKTGWVVSARGSIVKTTNGGRSWIVQHKGGATLMDVCFINRSRGWAVGDPGTTYRTTNGGHTWSKVLVPTSMEYRWLTAVSFYDAFEGRVVGGYPNGDGVATHQPYGSIWWTTDGGKNWTEMAYGTSTPADVDIVSAARGLAVGELRHQPADPDDLGWNSTAQWDCGGMFWAGPIAMPAAYQSGVSGLLAIDLYGAGDLGLAGGYVGGGAPGSAIMLRTTDAGGSWTPVAVPLLTHVRDVQLVTASVGYAVGDGVGRRVLKTTDGGLTWKTKTTPIRAWLHKVDFVTPSTGCVLGEDSHNRLIVMRTVNGGTTWTRIR